MTAPEILNKDPLVSVVVTTKNEEKNIGYCLKSIASQTWQNIEIIVIDNASTDKTKEIASAFTSHVFDKGPERSAQRNFGMIEKAHGHYVMYVDADMILSPGLVERCVERMQRGDCIALCIPEIVLGTSFWSQVRRFERGFYDGTVIDGSRFFDKDSFISVGGFDEQLNGPEDWDLDKKLKLKGTVVLLKPSRGIDGGRWELSEFVKAKGGGLEQESVIFHNEAEFKFWRYLAKKRYYATNFHQYILKWGKDDPDLRKQFGWKYRYFIVFIEEGKWKRLINKPLMCFGMFFLRIFVGLVFLLSALPSNKQQIKKA